MLTLNAHSTAPSEDLEGYFMRVKPLHDGFFGNLRSGTFFDNI